MALPTGRPQLSDETPGPALALLCICSAAASAVVAGSTIGYQVRQRQLDRVSHLDAKWNILLTAGLIVSITQSVVTFKQVDSGLGYQIDTLSAHDLVKLEQLEYANNLLYIGALFLLKGVHFLLQFATTFPKPNYYVPGGIMLGMVALFFAAAFECDKPFWVLRTGQCFNQVAFWIAFGIFDILSDVYSTSVVLHASSGLNMKFATKVKLIIVVGSKLLPAACAVARLPFIHPSYISANYTIESYKLAMPTQLQLHLAVVTLSLGKIFRFLNALDVGYLSSAIEPPSRKGTQKTYGISSLRSKTTQAKVPSRSDSSKHLVPSDYGRTTTRVEAVPLEEVLGHVDLKSGDGQLHIHVRRDVEIHHEFEENESRS